MQNKAFIPLFSKKIIGPNYTSGYISNLHFPNKYQLKTVHMNRGATEIKARKALFYSRTQTLTDSPKILITD